jgi:hypothetical protein
MSVTISAGVPTRPAMNASVSTGDIGLASDNGVQDVVNAICASTMEGDIKQDERIKDFRQIEHVIRIIPTI